MALYNWSTTCLFCGAFHRYSLTEEQYTRWRINGEYIQNVFPHMSAADRETMISGSCADCFDKAFGTEED